MVPLLHHKIDWQSIQTMIQYHNKKVKQSYEMKHSVIDRKQNQLNRHVFCQNGACFVPLNASKQAEIVRIKHWIEEEDDFYEQIVAKIGSNVPSKGIKRR
eukprot:24181_1